MTGISIIELDDKLVKAIKIMNSGYPNAAEQLKQILDEAIKEKYGSRKPVSVLSKLTSNGSGSAKKLSSGLSSGHNDDISMKKPKLLTEAKIKLSSKQHVPSPSNSPSPPTISIPEDDIEMKSDESSRASSDSRGSPGLEIVDDYNVCSVCKNKRGGAISGNKLIECAECHSSYHQECHTPPISDSDAADPRLIWYCVQCMRTMNKKQSAPVSKSNTKPSSSKSGSYYTSSSGGTSGSSSGKYSNITSSSKSSSSSNKPAASGATTSSSLISADKRIQIMKKRAASKKPEPPKKSKK